MAGPSEAARADITPPDRPKDRALRNRVLYLPRPKGGGGCLRPTRLVKLIKCNFTV